MQTRLAFLIAGLLVFTGCKVSDGNDDTDGDKDGGGQSHDDAGEDGPTKPTKDAGDGSHTTMDAGGNGNAGSMADTDASMISQDGGGDDAGMMMSTVVDPAPDMDMPGEYSCDGCPEADVSEFELDLGNVTSQTFAGMVTDAVGNGAFYLESEDGQSIGGAIPTDSSGAYSFTLPLFCGTQLLKCLWSNDSGTYVAVVQIVTADCVQADIRLTLTWDDLGLDYELHLIKEGGHINDNLTDCTWTSCIGTGPDWGVAADATDDPRKDVDNTGNYGPENIFYAKPEDGTYTVMVEHWGSGTADSDGQITINLLGEEPTTIDITDLTSHHVFTAATIEWPSKAVTAVGTDYDCTANWSGGCRDAIP